MQKHATRITRWILIFIKCLSLTAAIALGLILLLLARLNRVWNFLPQAKLLPLWLFALVTSMIFRLVNTCADVESPQPLDWEISLKKLPEWIFTVIGSAVILYMAFLSASTVLFMNSALKILPTPFVANLQSITIASPALRPSPYSAHQLAFLQAISASYYDLCQNTALNFIGAQAAATMVRITLGEILVTSKTTEVEDE